MPLLYCALLLAAYPLAVGSRKRVGGELSRMLWGTYLLLGFAALFFTVGGADQPLFGPNYGAMGYLVVCIALLVRSFRGFSAHSIDLYSLSPGALRLIERWLVLIQLYAIAFFLPFAAASLSGNANENRLNLADKMEVLASFGLWNTLAGVASNLFAVSLVLACLRLAHGKSERGNVGRAGLLIVGSLSYVVYIVAYVGRDGVVFWTMTAAVVLAMFWPHLHAMQRRRIATVCVTAGAAMLIPFSIITVARFVESEQGVILGISEYFGAQLNNFADYSSIERPRTFGIVSFPMLAEPACSVVSGGPCELSEDLKDIVFAQYLEQGIEPWLFGTFVSDFVGDFGPSGALLLVAALALVSWFASSGRDNQHRISLSRVLIVLLCFFVPYWGVFYFRFAIANSFIVVNLAVVVAVWALEQRARRRLAALSPALR